LVFRAAKTTASTALRQVSAHVVAAVLMLALFLVAAQARPDHALSQRFESDEGDVTFVLDRTDRLAKLLMLDGEAAEADQTGRVVLLTAFPAERGEWVFRDLQGRRLLRLAPFGGATFYGLDGKADIPVWPVSAAEPVRLPVGSRQAALLDALGLSAGLTAALGRPVAVEPLPNAAWADETAEAEGTALGLAMRAAMQNAGVAINRLSKDDPVREALARRLDRVRIVLADADASEREDLLLAEGVLSVVLRRPESAGGDRAGLNGGRGDLPGGDRTEPSPRQVPLSAGHALSLLSLDKTPGVPSAERIERFLVGAVQARPLAGEDAKLEGAAGDTGERAPNAPVGGAPAPAKQDKTLPADTSPVTPG